MQNIENSANQWPEPEPVKTEKIKLVDDEEHQLVWRDVVMIMLMVTVLVALGAQTLAGT